jgi:hypothetical protein
LTCKPDIEFVLVLPRLVRTMPSSLRLDNLRGAYDWHRFHAYVQCCMSLSHQIALNADRMGRHVVHWFSPLPPARVATKTLDRLVVAIGLPTRTERVFKPLKL